MVRGVYSAVSRHAGRIHPRPALVFVPARRQTRSTAVDIFTMAAADGTPQRLSRNVRIIANSRFLHISEQDETFKELLATVQDETLRETLSQGVGFLHEGTSAKDFTIVENLFNSGAIQVRLPVFVN